MNVKNVSRARAGAQDIDTASSALSANQARGHSGTLQVASTGTAMPPIAKHLR